jgi:hypothetical protein
MPDQHIRLFIVHRLLKHLTMKQNTKNANVPNPETVSAALGISESRKEELHNRMNNAIDDLNKTGNRIGKSDLITAGSKISTDPIELVYLGFMLAEATVVMGNPMTALAAMLSEDAE